MTAPDSVTPAGSLAGHPHLQDLAGFVQASPSSYHAAAEVARRLQAVGYTRVDERADFPAQPGGYVLVRDGAVIAWRIPEGAGLPGARVSGAGSAGAVPVFRILGAHTDSRRSSSSPARRPAGRAGCRPAWRSTAGRC